MTRFSSKRPLTDAEEADVQAMIASDPDAPELSDTQGSNPMSFSEAVRRKRGRPPEPNALQAVTLRLEPEVVERFKRRGDDWRKQMAQALKSAG